MKFNGTKKQNEWAAKILNAANLTDEQVDNLLRWAGPTLHQQGIMDAGVVIDNRDDLGRYANSLGEFYKKSPEQKKAVAQAAADAVREIANSI